MGLAFLLTVTFADDINVGSHESIVNPDLTLEPVLQEHVGHKSNCHRVSLRKPQDPLPWDSCPVGVLGETLAEVSIQTQNYALRLNAPKFLLDGVKPAVCGYWKTKGYCKDGTVKKFCGSACAASKDSPAKPTDSSTPHLNGAACAESKWGYMDPQSEKFVAGAWSRSVNHPLPSHCLLMQHLPLSLTSLTLAPSRSHPLVLTNALYFPLGRSLLASTITLSGQSSTRFHLLDAALNVNLRFLLSHRLTALKRPSVKLRSRLRTSRCMHLSTIR